MSLRLLRCCFCIGLALGVVARAEVLRVGIETNAAPMSYIQPDGKIGGFTVDMINAIAANRHLELVPVVGDWPEIYANFKAGEIDVLVSLAYTAERANSIDFAVTHLTMHGTLFIRRGTLFDPAALADARLAVQRDSFSHDYVRRRGWDKHLVFVANFREAMHALEEGRCDAVTAIDIIGQQVVRTDRLDHVAASGFELPDYTFELHMGVHSGDARHLATLNEGLARIRADGTYDRIYEKWIGPLQPHPLSWAQVQPYLVPLVIVLIGVAVVIVLQRRGLAQVRQQAEARRESEERLRLVLEGSGDGFWDWDVTSGRFARSERWAAMLGYTLDEIPPTLEGGGQLVHPDDKAAHDGWRGKVNSGDSGSYTIEYRMRAKSGEWRWILDRGKVVARGPDGAPLRIAGTHTDVTERKRTEQSLLENRELLARSAKLLEQTQAAAHIGGWEVDATTRRAYWTEENHRIHETDPATYEPTIDSALAFYTPESRALVSAAVEKAIRDGTPYDFEATMRTASGRLVAVHTTGRVERRDGRVVRIYGSFQDITAKRMAEDDQKKIQLKMLEAQKLESLGVLAGGIAHDFNNLLTVILANASFARLASPNDANLAPIETAARRAADLCRQMLAYAGHGNLIVERVDLGHLVHDTARLLEVSISKKASLYVSLAPELPPVEGDASQLRQVVMNLVINASESLGETSGEIRVTTRAGRPNDSPADAVHSFDFPAGDGVCLEVTDTGAGMSPATIARVFDPFFTTKFTGRGLGLAATLGIVRTHNGALTVASSPGHGSTFRLYLPAAVQRTKSSTEASTSTTTALGGGTLLVVDDESTVLSTTDSLLRHYGYGTALASDGVEALRLFTATPDRFAAVLLDLTMPGLDGAEVLRGIRALRPAARVIVMSGFSEQDVLHRLRGLGEVTLLHKPFALETLLTKVKEVLVR